MEDPKCRQCGRPEAFHALHALYFGNGYCEECRARDRTPKPRWQNSDWVLRDPSPPRDDTPPRRLWNRTPTIGDPLARDVSDEMTRYWDRNVDGWITPDDPHERKTRAALRALAELRWAMRPREVCVRLPASKPRARKEPV